MRGRSREGDVSPSELIEAGERLYGPQWRQPLADLLEVDLSTIRRWTSGKSAVPKPVALAINLMLEKERQR